jgi:ankyrin repeat protein
MSAAELFAAIDAGSGDDVAAILAAEPALASACDADGVSATMHALYRRQANVAATLAATLPALDIFESAALGQVERVRELLAVDPSLARARSPDGFTALHYPGFFGVGDAAEAARTLLAAGADVNARSDNAFSVLPLHSSVAGGHEEVTAVLIDAGGDVNAAEADGWTPLHAAAMNGSRDSVERLLAAGADPAARKDDGVDALQLAREAGHATIAELLERLSQRG